MRRTITQLAQLQKEIRSWPGITSSAFEQHGEEFSLGTADVGHIHDEGMVDLPFTVALRKLLVAHGLCQPHYYHPQSGWITFYLGKDGGVSEALLLFRLSYLRYLLRRDRTLECSDCPTRAEALRELNDMSLPAAIRAQLGDRAQSELRVSESA